MKNNSVSIYYHKYREAVAAGVAHISKEGTATNLVDMFTKMLVFYFISSRTDLFVNWFCLNVEVVVFFQRKGYKFLPIRG